MLRGARMSDNSCSGSLDSKEVAIIRKGEMGERGEKVRHYNIEKQI